MGGGLAGPAEPRAPRGRRAEDLRRSDVPRDRRGDRPSAGDGRHAIPVGPGETARPDGGGPGMIDDIERRLRRMAPRGAPTELRARVLATVADHLAPAVQSSPRRKRRPALAVAAGLLASLGLNIWVNDR